ncbi:MAG: hypothetical protein ING69_10690 [Rhodocyclaceae bacterium]|nr:hypothetical protein [Rhodocyclaceae bacterium]
MKAHFERQTKENGDELVLTLLSFDEAEGRAVYLRTGLSPVTHEGRSFHELWFDIYVVYDDDRSPDSIQNGLFTKGLISDDVRWLVFMFVMESVGILIEEIGPKEIYRVVKLAGLPDKAMRKHHMLTSALEELGYYVFKSGLDTMDRECWFMRRQ